MQLSCSHFLSAVLKSVFTSLDVHNLSAIPSHTRVFMQNEDISLVRGRKFAATNNHNQAWSKQFTASYPLRIKPVNLASVSQ